MATFARTYKPHPHTHNWGAEHVQPNACQVSVVSWSGDDTYYGWLDYARWMDVEMNRSLTIKWRYVQVFLFA